MFSFFVHLSLLLLAVSVSSTSAAQQQPTGWKLTQHYNTSTCKSKALMYECRSYGTCVIDWATRRFKTSSYPVILVNAKGNYSITHGFYNDSACTVPYKPSETVSENIDDKQKCDLAPPKSFDRRISPYLQVSVVPGAVPPAAPFFGVVASWSQSKYCDAGYLNQFVSFSLSECAQSEPTDKSGLSFKYSCGAGGDTPQLLTYTTTNCKGAYKTKILNTDCQLDTDTGFYWHFNCGTMPSYLPAPPAAGESETHARDVWLGCGLSLAFISLVIVYWIYSRRQFEAKARFESSMQSQGIAMTNNKGDSIPSPLRSSAVHV